MAAASAAEDIENMSTAILLLLLSAIWLPTPGVRFCGVKQLGWIGGEGFLWRSAAVLFLP